MRIIGRSHARPRPANRPPDNRRVETTTGTQTTSGARDHAARQAGSQVRGMPTIPASEAVDVPADLTACGVWAETVEPGNYPTTSHAARSCGSPTSRATPARHLLLHNARHRRAAERRGHGQGPVERLPRRRPAAPLRPGPRPRRAGRRHLRPARRAVRHPEPPAPRRAYGDGAPQGPSAAGARACSWPPPRTGSSRATSARARLLPGRPGRRRRRARLRPAPGAGGCARDPARRAAT